MKCTLEIVSIFKMPYSVWYTRIIHICNWLSSEEIVTDYSKNFVKILVFSTINPQIPQLFNICHRVLFRFKHVNEFIISLFVHKLLYEFRIAYNIRYNGLRIIFSYILSIVYFGGFLFSWYFIWFAAIIHFGTSSLLYFWFFPITLFIYNFLAFHRLLQ